MSTMKQSLFERIDCPLCGSADFTVVLPSRYPPGVTQADMEKIYCASSDGVLLDQLVQCRKCSLKYVNPRLAGDLIVASYEAAVDPAFVAQNEQRIRTFEATLRTVLRRIGRKVSPGERLLDVGCAGGACLVAAKNLGFQPIGVEPSRWLAEFGRKQYGLDVQQGILQPGMFPAESFDVISLWDVIEHVPQPAALLDTIHGLLKPAGLLLVNYPDIDSVMARLLGRKWPFLLGVHLLYYTRQTMTRQLERAGFEVIHVRPHWQSLQLGYVLKRAAAYIRAVGLLQAPVRWLGAERLPVTYNMGQTLVAARKKN